MEEKDLKNAFNQIPVPKERVLKAIDDGLNQVVHEKKRRQPKKKLLYGGVASIAILSLTISSGFIIPSLNKVLAKAPIVGGIFKDFNDPLGIELAEQNLVTELNKTSTKKGINVTLTSAYFDGYIVSITGHVDGDIKKQSNEESEELSVDENFENYEGDADPWFNGQSTVYKKKGDGYDFQMTLNYPYEELKENYTLPLTIHSINGVDGDWRFSIPISQEKNKATAIDYTKNYPNENVQIKVNELLFGRISSTVMFETNTEYEKDEIYIWKATDHKGKELDIGNSVRFNKGIDGEVREFRRSTIGNLNQDVKTITFYPHLERSEPLAEKDLATGTSFTLESQRSNKAIRVNSIKHEQDKLIVDYQVLGFPKSLKGENYDRLLHNLGYQFNIIDPRIDLDDDWPFYIHRNHVEVLNKDTMHFQSVFDLSGEVVYEGDMVQKITNFEMDHAILQFDFNSFLDTVELEPFTVKIPQKKEQLENHK
ncbi:DUF4179 domain-containing protein [Bacillus sp. D386]|uniref:DUF4179 domain-containing protein n=1 Tax=Bacillus sp. D386 TaxID=2587155 RepID=UPI0015D5A79D|nr:DUF4179 domain-containing protein [Bacillus sp. D386]